MGINQDQQDKEDIIYMVVFLLAMLLAILYRIVFALPNDF